MIRSAELARVSGVRLHTHLAETADEEEFCLEKHGCTPAEYAESLGWLGPDVWLAHCVHLNDDAIKRLAVTGTGTAHCPSSNARLGAGHAPIKALIDAGAPVGLGVDGAASQESGMLVEELRSALYISRLRAGTAAPAQAVDVRTALRLGTIGGAHLLGRADEIGSLEPGKYADPRALAARRPRPRRHRRPRRGAGTRPAGPAQAAHRARPHGRRERRAAHRRLLSAGARRPRGESAHDGRELTMTPTRNVAAVSDPPADPMIAPIAGRLAGTTRGRAASATAHCDPTAPPRCSAPSPTPPT